MLRQLEYLSALDKYRHFGRAAAACRVTQPGLSAGIRKLEAEFDVVIVKRAQRFEGLTPEGEQILDWGRRLLAERESLGDSLAGARGELTGTLRIGAIPTALSISALITAPLRERHPLVRFHVESMSSSEIVARLNDFEIDVGVSYVDGDPLGKVRVLPLYKERYLFVTAHPRFADHARVEWGEASEAQLCLLTPDMQNRRIIDGHFAEAGHEARPVLETNSISTIYAHIGAMGLSSVMPDAWVRAFGLPTGTRALPMRQPRRTYSVGLVLAGSGPESHLARVLAEIARAQDLSH